MDRITSALMNDFAKDWGLDTDERSTFEHFCNYLILSQEYRQTFALDDVFTGTEADSGIDGLAIIVNGKLANSTEEIDDLIETAGYLDVDIIFIQSKTSAKFDGSEIGNFIFGVKDFVSEEPQLVQNDAIRAFHEMWECCLLRTKDMFRRLPNCKLYYATTGKWVDDQNLTTLIDRGVNELKGLELFADISFTPCGALEIRRFHRGINNRLSATVNFTNKITLPEIEGIGQAYFGVLPFSEFKKLIFDDNNKILDVFYDNIRDFDGYNTVNQGIRKTLTDRKFDLFCVLNNGVTIVANSLTPAGNKFTLRDYQVVNGCQTSHVLFRNSEIEGIEDVYVPVRIVVTNNEEIRNLITLATNSQTEVKPEQLAAQTEFQKSLEQYYVSIVDPIRLYYERRSQQYNLMPDIKKTQVITIPIQIKAFSSMFLQAPHSVSGYFGTIMKKHKDKLFDRNHRYSPYYTSGLAYYRLETLFRNGSLDRFYKKAKFHLIMIFRMIGNPSDLPYFNSRKIDDYCQVLINILNDPDKCSATFERAIEVFKGSGLDHNQRQYKSEAETSAIIAHVKHVVSKTSSEPGDGQAAMR